MWIAVGAEHCCCLYLLPMVASKKITGKITSKKISGKICTRSAWVPEAAIPGAASNVLEHIRVYEEFVDRCLLFPRPIALRRYHGWLLLSIDDRWRRRLILPCNI